MNKTYPYPSGEGKVKWVSADWLADHLNDQNLYILDVQPNVHDYIMGHIPGAIYLNEGVLRSAWKSMPAMYISPESIGPIFRRAGLDPNVPTVVYTGAGRYSQCVKGLGDGLEQTMMAYSLTRFGHNRVYILDGGIEVWKKEGHELTKKFPECQESNFQVEVRKDYFIDYDEFKKLKDSKDVLVFDARPTDSYLGGNLWTKPGHIPGAISLPWRSLMNKENSMLLKSDEEIDQILAPFDITHDKTLLIYCGTGREATNEFLYFKWYRGHDRVRIYEGSFTEWSAHPENETVTGPNPL
jgi:thiosulfate/3-mercaptopyruvate sulfurtransferase